MSNLLESQILATVNSICETIQEICEAIKSDTHGPETSYRSTIPQRAAAIRTLTEALNNLGWLGEASTTTETTQPEDSES